MKALMYIAKKDFKALIKSPMFWIIAGLCTALVWSPNFVRLIYTFSQRAQLPPQYGGGGGSIFENVFFPHIQMINLILVFAIPAFTMRLIAEEKKQRTYDLLLTSPISATQIAVGKFLGGFGAVALLLGISFIYPLYTVLFADFNMKHLLVCYLGLFLASGVYVATGLFASSLSESVVLSVMVGLLLNLMFWFTGQNIEFSDNPTYRAVFEHMSIGYHLLGFVRGGLSITGAVFFLSVISLFVFLSQRVVEASRWR